MKHVTCNFNFAARNVKKCNSQTTGPGGHPSRSEPDTVVERPNLVQDGQIWPSSCCIAAFVCILLHLRARRKAKKKCKCTAYVYENRMKNIKTIQALVRRLANEQSLYARAALELFKGAVCWRLFSLSPLTPRPSFLLLTPLSVLFTKPVWGKP